VIEDLRSLLTSWRSHAGFTYLFPSRHPNHHWKHLHPDSADKILRKAFSRAGIEGASTHSFRRTALSQMSNAGIPLRIIQEISGHSNLEQLQRYLDVKPDQVKGAITSLSMLSERGIAPFPDRRVACGQLSTPAARDSSLPSRAVATFPSSALNSAFTSAFIYSIAPDALMISVIRSSKLSDADCLTSTASGKTI
jgi:hypothetical protein